MPLALDWPRATLPQEISADEIHLWAWGLDPDPDALTPGHTALLDTATLDDDELERFRRFYFDRDRLRFAAAHARLRQILSAYLDRSPDSLRFETNLYGKPRIVHPQVRDPQIRDLQVTVPQTTGKDRSRARPLHFNLSHSHGLALLALSLDTEVGVDVEEIHPIEREVAESHFSRAELSALEPLEGDLWLRGFYQCWTRKEAVLKAEGAGLNLPLDAFDVSLGPGVPAALLATRPPLNFRHHWKLHALGPASGAIGALAAGNAEAQVRCFSLAG